MTEEKMEPRKASDILLAIEERMNSVVKIVALHDTNIKIILDRVNKIYTYISKLEAEYNEEHQLQENNNATIVNVSSENNIPIAEKPTSDRRTPRVETYTASVTPSNQEPTSFSTDKDKKVPVTQRVTDNTGKDLFMAEVSILDNKKELVMKTKTNAAGKWQAYLKPGNYSITIIKTDTVSKKKIEGYQDISVADTNSAITLKPIIIVR